MPTYEQRREQWVSEKETEVGLKEYQKKILRQVFDREEKENNSDIEIEKDCMFY